jgi:hypothetical protein
MELKFQHLKKIKKFGDFFENFSILEVEIGGNGPGILGVNSRIFDKYGLHNGLPKLQERPENGLWSFRG